MKIALLIDSLVAGGAQRQMTLLANGLAKRGYEVELFHYHDNLQLLDDLALDRIRIVSIKKTWKADPLFIGRLCFELWRSKPQVLISFLLGPNFWARVCGTIAGTEKIIISERSTNLDRSKLLVLLERTLSRLSCRTVVNTYTGKRRLVKHLRLPPEKIRVIYNGVDTARFITSNRDDPATKRSSYDLRTNDFVIVLPGRIEVPKNHSCLIQAIALLDYERYRIRALFVGNESNLGLKSELVEQIKQCRLNKHVTFCGHCDDMPAIYNLADVVVLPSLWEGLPNVVLEAMACETPVIVSDVSDNSLVVLDGVTGYLFAQNNPNALAEKISVYLTKTDEERKTMGILARKRVEDVCSPSTYVNNFIDLINEV